MLGGAEIMTHNLVRFQRGAGHAVMVITNRREPGLAPVEDMHGATVHRIDFGDAFARREGARIAGLARQVRTLQISFQADVVHLHLGAPSAWFHFLAGASAPLLVTVHCPLGDLALPATFQERVWRTAAHITTVTPQTRRDLADSFPWLAAKATVVPNGYPAPEAVTDQSDSPPILLCVGRLAAEKGFDLAVRALARIRRRHPTCRLIIVGDGNQRVPLQALAESLGLADSIRFTGWKSPDQVAQMMRTATAILVPSRCEEQFGLVALEGSFNARPVVAAQIGGLPEVVRHHETGLLFPPNDAEALAAAVEELLNNPDEARRLGANGRRRCIALFAFDRCAAEYGRLYALISSKAG